MSEPADRTIGGDAWRFALVVLVTLIVLAMLNALPEVLGGEPRGVVRYTSASDVEQQYGVKLWQPVAGPAWLRTPWRVRVAVGSPDWVQFLFRDGTLARAAVCQTLQPAVDVSVPGELLAPADLLQADEIGAGRRSGQVRRLLRPDGTIVHELWWQEQGRTIMLRLDASADEIMRLAGVILGNR